MNIFFEEHYMIWRKFKNYVKVVCLQNSRKKMMAGTFPSSQLQLQELLHIS